MNTRVAAVITATGLSPFAVDEVMPRVGADYGTGECPAECHVMGVSMGGSGATRFAHHRPDRFGTLTAISGPVMNTAQMASFVDDRLLAIVIAGAISFSPCLPRLRGRAKRGLARVLLAA